MRLASCGPEEPDAFERIHAHDCAALDCGASRGKPVIGGAAVNFRELEEIRSAHFQLPSSPRPERLVQEFANRRALPIRMVDPLELQVDVTRNELLAFLDDVFDSEAYSPIDDLRRHVQEHLRVDATYVTAADELFGTARQSA
jgi:hypothetical protein